MSYNKITILSYGKDYGFVIVKGKPQDYRIYLSTDVHTLAAIRKAGVDCGVAPIKMDSLLEGDRDIVVIISISFLSFIRKVAYY